MKVQVIKFCFTFFAESINKIYEFLLRKNKPKINFSLFYLRTIFSIFDKI